MHAVQAEAVKQALTPRGLRARAMGRGNGKYAP
jgi:hypothetical protein